MKLTERSNGLYLENITRNDVRFANIGGRMTGSRYDDPNKPKHEYVVWLDNAEILEAFRSMNVTISERFNDETNETRYSIRLKAYPRIRINRRTGKEEQVPKVILRTGSNMVRLDKGSFGLVDSSYIENVDIKFHLYQYDEHKPDCIAAIDEMWVTVDEKAGNFDDTYLEEKYGYIEEDQAKAEQEDELPFD